MDTNESKSDQESVIENTSPYRYSKRIRKPIKVYQPETIQIKPKKSEYIVNCKILKMKGISFNNKKIIFNVSSNLSAGNLCGKLLKQANTSQFETIFVYFCKEKNSK